jgi:hypothetical protein
MTINNIASAVAKTCSSDTLAAIISSLLDAADNENLSDDEAEAGQTLFDCLIEIVPESTVELAQSL